MKHDSSDKVPFNQPYMAGNELRYIADAHKNGQLAGDGPFTKQCSHWLERSTTSHKVLLTHSCTAALEIAALLLNLQPQDEIIMPSYTFASTANAFVLRGAIPVFVDIREDTLNIDEVLIEDAITPRTRAIVVVHYAGVACEMDRILAIAQSHNLIVIEDAAQGVMSTYKGRALGSIGSLGAYSFHETKNIISGEGGALLVNDPRYALQAEIIREKGTNRGQFFRGEVDKYSWQGVGSSYLPGELIAAFLWAQLEHSSQITAKRIKAWNLYHSLLAPLEEEGYLRRPIVPIDCSHNAHIYYVVLHPQLDRDRLVTELKDANISLIPHYVPLHSSKAGLQYGRSHGEFQVTNHCATSLLRLPLFYEITADQQSKVVRALTGLMIAKTSVGQNWAD